MTFKYKRSYQGIFYLVTIIQFTVTYSAEYESEIVSFPNIDKLPKLGEFCWFKICQENQFCNDEFVCQCIPGCRVYNNNCIPVAEENEECTVQEDCCGKLVCVNGICRKPVFSSEFVTLAKICLGITVTTIIIAVFSSLIKCLLKVEGASAFQRDSEGLNSTFAFQRPVLNLGSDQHEIRDEKPPSYEECVRSAENNLVVEAPPPYIISNNSVFSTVENPATQVVNSPVVRNQNSTTINI